MTKRTTAIHRSGVTGCFVAHGPARTASTLAERVDTLGGRIDVGLAPIAQVEIIRKGLDVGVIDTLSDAVGMPAYKFAEALNISARTMTRRKKKSEPLDPSQSEKMLRVRRVLQEAISVVGRRDPEKAVAWLNREERSLGGVTPLSLLDTSAGEEAVLNVLRAIREGIVL